MVESPGRRTSAGTCLQRTEPGHDPAAGTRARGPVVPYRWEVVRYSDAAHTSFPFVHTAADARRRARAQTVAFWEKEHSWRTAWRARSLLSRTNRSSRPARGARTCWLLLPRMRASGRTQLALAWVDLRAPPPTAGGQSLRIEERLSGVLVTVIVSAFCVSRDRERRPLLRHPEAGTPPSTQSSTPQVRTEKLHEGGRSPGPAFCVQLRVRAQFSRAAPTPAPLVGFGDRH
jgi:hypothetical protein